MPTYVISYTQGNSSGPFDIYLSGSSGLNLYASNVSQPALANGYIVTFPNGIPSSSVEVFDVSYGCFTTQNIPWPSVTPSVTPSITVSPSRTPSISVSPSKTPSLTPSLTPTPSVTPPPSVTPSVTVTPTPSQTPDATPTPTPSQTPTPSITRTPSPSPPPPGPLNYVGASSPYSSPYLACFAAATGGFTGGSGPSLTTYYINPQPPIPPNGSLLGYTLFYNSNFTSPVIGNNLFYIIWFNGTGQYQVVRVTNTGLIITWLLC